MFFTAVEKEQTSTESFVKSKHTYQRRYPEWTMSRHRDASNALVLLKTAGLLLARVLEIVMFCQLPFNHLILVCTVIFKEHDNGGLVYPKSTIKFIQVFVKYSFGK